MKIWLFTTEYPPFFGGGISTYCRHTVTMFSGVGVDVTVFLCDGSVRETIVGLENGIRLVRFSPFHYREGEFLGHETLVSFAFAEVARSFIKDEGAPDIIEAQDYNGIAYFTLLYKKLLYEEFQKPAVVVTVHAPSFICQPFNQVSSFKLPYFWIHEMEKFCLQAADHIVAPSQYILNLINSDQSLPAGKCSMIRNPFYPNEASAINNDIKKREFVFYGKASPLKGIMELLRYCEKFWAENDAFVLRMLGGTDHYYHPEQQLMGDLIGKRYKKQIENGQLIVEGPIHQDELPKKIKSANAIIFPSLVDNFPYAVIECMAAGKVVLASYSGGQKEIISDGENGFLFNVHEPEGFYGKISEIVNLDEERRHRICANARAAVDINCGPMGIAKEKIAVYQGLISQRINKTVFPFLRQELASGANLPGQSPQPGLLSVVVPCYNMGVFLEETIASIFAASFKPIEIIIVNDGSTEERTLEVLEKLRSNSFVNICDIANGGLARARNFGALQAKGEFLAFLDADDTVAPLYYHKAIQLLQHYENVFFVGSWVSYSGMREGIWPCFTPEPPFLLVHNMANTSGMVYKRSAFLNAGMNDPGMVFGMEDYESLIMMVGKGYNGVIIPFPFFNYRVRKGSMMRQFTVDKMIFLHELIAKKNTTMFEKYATAVAGLLNANGPGYAYDNPTLDYHIERNTLMKLLIKNSAVQRLKHNKYFRKPLLRAYKIFNKK